VTLGERARFRLLLSCGPIYDSGMDARKHGEEIVDEIRLIDFDAKRKELANLIG
jgi:hypothetical protein